MRYLLDSHVVVWWSLYPGRLKATIRDAIIAPDNEVFISAVSAWELEIKMAKGKLQMPADYLEKLASDGFEELPLISAHGVLAARLPPIHADPFDRVLIAQAITEGLKLITADQVIARYDVPVLAA